MPVRSAFPVAAIVLAFGAVGACSSNAPDQVTEGSSSAQVRPAQMQQMSQCDQLASQVESRMSTAKAYRVPFAQKDLAEARELCHSGQPEEGISMLNGALGYMDQEP